MAPVRVELLLFDLDGTLIDSGDDIAAAVNETLQKLKRGARPVPEIISYVGRGVDDLIRRVLDTDDPVLCAEAVAIFREYYYEHATKQTRLYPHVAETLRTLQDKMMIVVTNKPERIAAQSLEALKIASFFRGIVGGDDASCLKPSVCQVEKAFAMAGSPVEQGRTMIVGDMDIDIMTGKQAGILTCAVTYGLGKREDILRVKPDFVIDRFDKLIEVAV